MTTPDRYWPKIQQGKFQDEPRPGRDWVLASTAIDPVVKSCYSCYVAGQLTWNEMLFEIAFHQTQRLKQTCKMLEGLLERTSLPTIVTMKDVE